MKVGTRHLFSYLWCALLANFNNMYLIPVFKAHALENHPKSTVLLSETDTENVDKPTKKESEILKEVDGKKLLLDFVMDFVVVLKSSQYKKRAKI